jgi:hypothetical protein
MVIDAVTSAVGTCMPPMLAEFDFFIYTTTAVSVGSFPFAVRDLIESPYVGFSRHVAIYSSMSVGGNKTK